MRYNATCECGYEYTVETDAPVSEKSKRFPCKKCGKIVELKKREI